MAAKRRVTYNPAKHSRTQVTDPTESYAFPVADDGEQADQTQPRETAEQQEGGDGALEPADRSGSALPAKRTRSESRLPGGGDLIPARDAARWARALRDHVIRMIEHLEGPEQLDKLQAHIDRMAESENPNLQEAAAKLRRAMVDSLSERMRIVAEASKAAEATENAGPPATPGGAWAQVIVQNNAAPLDNAT